MFYYISFQRTTYCYDGKSLRKTPYWRDRLQHTEVDADEPAEVLVSKTEALHVKVHLSITAQVRNLLGQNVSAQNQWIVVQKGRNVVRNDCQRDRSQVKSSSRSAEQTSAKYIWNECTC